MDSLVQHLRALGLTEMEARIVVSLSEQGPMTGYEAAKKLGVSRSNVYAALQRLVDHGFVLHRQGEPSYYTSIQPEELTRTINSRLEASLRYVEQHMPATQADDTDFFSIEGERAVTDALRRALHEAQFEIIADVWPEEATALRTDLEQAEARGVRVLWSIADIEEHKHGVKRSVALLKQTAHWRNPNVKGEGEEQADLGSLIQDESSATTEEVQGSSQAALQGMSQPQQRKFSIVIDRKRAIIGTRGEGRMAKALVTSHEAVTDLVMGHFAQELILYELEQQWGPDLEQVCGERYERTLKRYFDFGENDSER
ncbi:MarR family transcriptional regulator [Paenibacillus sp. 481]|nr:MarR family transcriptional regulator [Paenibacillus sp. 481]